MAVKDLNYFELARFARVQEAKIAFKSNDPLISGKMDYIIKADSGTLTQEEFDKCLNNKFPEIFIYMKDTNSLYTEENLIKALRIDGLLLRFIHSSKQTANVIANALAQNGLALEYAEEDLLTDDLVKIAIRQNPECKNSLIRILNESSKS